MVCAVATQGNPGGNRDYVRRYKLQCSADGVNWTLYEENGNTVGPLFFARTGERGNENWERECVQVFSFFLSLGPESDG